MSAEYQAAKIESINRQDALCRAYAGVAAIRSLVRNGEPLSADGQMKIVNLTALILRDIKATLPGVIQGEDEGQPITV